MIPVFDSRACVTPAVEAAVAPLMLRMARADGHRPGLPKVMTNFAGGRPRTGRNDKIYAAWRAGASRGEIAARYKVSRQYVCQVIRVRARGES